MIAPYPDIDSYTAPRQAQIDWLLKLGVDIETMIRPEPIRLAYGLKGHDGKFDEDPEGQAWLVLPEAEDVIFWQPKTGDMATWNGLAFALGEEVIDAPGTYSFDCQLTLFPTPLHWLQAKRDGIVVLDWSRAYERLKNCPRIAVMESLVLPYRRHMKPPPNPETYIIPASGRIAA